MKTTEFDIRDLLTKNLFINGRLDLWQRGTSVSVAASTKKYLADRLAYDNGSAAAVITYSQQTTVPTLAMPLKFHARALVSTIDASLAAGEYAAFNYTIEGNDFIKLKNQTAYIGFYVRSTLTGTYTLAAQNSAANRSYVATYTINAANTWEYKLVSIPFVSESTGTWLFDTGVGAKLTWGIQAASTSGTFSTASPNTWVSANASFIDNMPNFLGTASNAFDLAGIVIYNQPFTSTEYLQILNAQDVGEEIRRCQRYFEKSYDMAVAPGTATVRTNDFTTTNVGGNDVGMYIQYRIIKRTAGTISVYNEAGSIGQSDYQLSGGGTGTSAASLGQTSTTSFNITAVDVAGVVRRGFQWTADADF